MDNRLNTAIYLKEVGGLKQSINLLKEYIRENTSNIEAYGHLIDALSLNSQNKEAWHYLKKAEKLEEYNLIILSHKAKLLLKDKKLKEAFTVIQFAFNIDNSSAFVLFTFSTVLRVMGKIDKAREALNLAIKADPKLAEAYALSAIYYNIQGDRINAIKDAKKALLLKPHIKVLESITATNNVLEAISVIKEVLKSIPPKKNIILLNKLANYQYKLHDLDGAMDTLNQLLSRVPNSVDVHIKIANILAEKQETDKAIEHYNKAKSHTPNNTQILNNLALCYEQKGEIKLAEKNYKKALIIKPNDYQISINFTNLMIEEERFNIALKIIKDALKLNPKEIKLYITLCICLREMGELDKALVEIKKALSIKSDSCQVQHQIAEIYRRQGKLEKAIESLHTTLACYLTDLEKTKIINPPSVTGYIDTKNAKKTLKKIHKAFNKKNIQIFLSSGTLLGIVRDGDILPHDKDMDIGVDWDVSRKLVEEILIEEGFKVKRLSTKDKEWLITGVDKDLDISVDFFFYKKLPNKTVYGFHGEPYPILWEFPHFELSEIEYDGDKWLIPSPYEMYCRTMYGEDWTVPNANYDTIISSSNLAKESEQLAICFGLSRLIRSIKVNNYKKAKGYCEQLLAIHNHPIIHKMMEKMEFILESYEKTKTIKG